MKQVLIRPDGAFVGDTPIPAISRGELLIAVHYSFISAGTETAAITVRPGPAAQNTPPPVPVAPAKQSLARKTVRLGLKVVKNPGKALFVAKAALQHAGNMGEFKTRMKQYLKDGTPLVRVPHAVNIVNPSDTFSGNASGYSAAGVVIQTGADVTGFAIGDPVACAGAGKANHAEFIAVPMNLCVKIPSELPMREACSVALGAIALQGVRRADSRLGEVVAVLGLGLLGHFTLQMLRHSGVRALGLDLDRERVERAHKLGFAECYSTAEELDAAVKAATLGMGADATIITASAKSDALCQHAMQLTRRKGRVVVVGDVGLGLQRAPFYAKEIDFLISCSYGPGRYDPEYEERGKDYPYAFVRWTERRNMALYLEMLRSGAVNIKALLDSDRSVDEVGEAYLDLIKPGPKPIASVIRYPAADGVAPSAIAEISATKTKAGILGWALVGTSGFGQAMLMPRFAKHANVFALKALVSRRGAHARNTAHHLGIPKVYGDLREALKDGEVQALCIVTRHSFHPDEIAMGLDAGRAVFCEKPIAVDWNGLEIVDAAVQRAGAGARLMVGFNRRFAPALKAIRDSLANRRGPLVAHYRMNAGEVPADSWVHGPEGGGRNIGEACHIYDLFGALTGSTPTSITAQAIAAQGNLARANENFNATIRFADGSICTLTYTSLGDAALGKERLEVFCGNQALILDDYLRVTRVAGGQTTSIYANDTADKGHDIEIKLWAEFLNGKGQAPLSWPEIQQASAIALWVEDLIHGRVGSNCIALSGEDLE